MRSPIPSSWTPQLLSVLRIIVAFLFIAHGTQKLFNVPGGVGPFPVEAFSLLWVAGVIELVGGSLMFVGLLTRPIAFVLAGEMAVAYFRVHASMGFWPIQNHGEPVVFYCFAFLYFAVAGAGPWSVDALLARRPHHALTPRPLAR